MNRILVLGLGACFTVVAGGWHPADAAQQVAPPLDRPAVDAPAISPEDVANGLVANDGPPVKALTEGPLHKG